jgi:hypothetical protein
VLFHRAFASVPSADISLSATIDMSVNIVQYNM